jgi:predicted PurR-regulated permease PerM
MKTIVLPYYARLAFVLISLLAIGYIAFIGKEVLAPLVFSFLFGLLLLPLARFFEFKCKLPRSAASMLSVLLFTGAIVLIGYIVWSQVTTLGQDIPLLKKQISSSLGDLHHWAESRFHVNVNQQIKKAESGAESAGTTVVSSTLLSLSSILLFLVFIFIYTFFMLFYRRLLVSFLHLAFDKKDEAVINDIVEEMQYIIKKYITGLFFEMCTVATLVFGILAILGVKYALLLGLITGIFNLIPYVGIFTAMGFSTLVTLGTLGPQKALMVAGSIVLVHLIDSNILMPRIVGSKVKINALVVVVGVIVGEMLWGLSGMFLSIPVIAIVKIIFDRVDELKPWGFLLGGLEYDRLIRFKKRKPDGLDKSVDESIA